MSEQKYHWWYVHYKVIADGVAISTGSANVSTKTDYFPRSQYNSTCKNIGKHCGDGLIAITSISHIGKATKAQMEDE